MESEIPEAVADLLTFLAGIGLVCQERRERGEPFDNKLFKFGSSDVVVRAVLDRGDWRVEIQELADPKLNQTQEKWYQPEVLQKLLFGNGKDPMSITEQAKFFERNWNSILDLFSQARREATRTELAKLKQERARRLFPHLYE